MPGIDLLDNIFSGSHIPLCSTFQKNVSIPSHENLTYYFEMYATNTQFIKNRCATGPTHIVVATICECQMIKYCSNDLSGLCKMLQPGCMKSLLFLHSLVRSGWTANFESSSHEISIRGVTMNLLIPCN